jgi:hypothetical protein
MKMPQKSDKMANFWGISSSSIRGIHCDEARKQDFVAACSVLCQEPQALAGQNKNQATGLAEACNNPKA